MDVNEFLINEVEKNPLLFEKTDREYKDTRKKKDVWDEIGGRLGLSDK